MTMSETQPPESGAALLRALARALSAAVVGRQMNQEERDALMSFQAASSVRAALPLGSEGPCVSLVSSDLRAPTTPPTFWATPAERSLVGQTLATGRTATAEGPSIHLLADTAQLAAAGGGGSFLCVPLLAAEPPLGVDPAPAVAALLLCYPSTDAMPQEELRLALLLATQLTREHGRELAAFVSRVHRAVQPEEHAEWGPGVDPEYPELEYPDSFYDGSGYSLDSGNFAGSGSGGGSGSSGGSGGAHLRPSALLANAPGHVLPHPAARWAMSPRSLRFLDHRLERRFQQWRNARLVKADAAMLLALLVHQLAACVLPPAGGWSLARLSASLPAALTVLVPLLLLRLGKSSRWYSRHRDQLLVGTYVLLACHQALDVPMQLTATAAVPEGLWRALAVHAELLWCVALGVILQVQFVGQCLMLVGGLALKALVQPDCASRLAGQLVAGAPGVDMAGCLVDSLARPLLLTVVLPCGVAYCTELSARRSFCTSMLARRSTRAAGPAT